MKKVYSILISGAIAISSLSAILANATNEESSNTLSVTSKSISENFVLPDGNLIPAGAVAITVGLSNNEGFSSSATKLNIENADYLLDENNKPIVVKGDLFNSSIISAATKDNCIVVASASAEEENGDGNMFTIFVSNQPSNVSVFDISGESIRTNQDDIAGARSVYYIGDVNHDYNIDAVDGSQVLQAIDTYSSAPFTVLPVSVANANLSIYFPYIPNAQIADTNINGGINKKDADNIMDFYAYVAVGHTWGEAYALFSQDYNYCSEMWY